MTPDPHRSAEQSATPARVSARIGRRLSALRGWFIVPPYTLPDLLADRSAAETMRRARHPR